MKCVLVFLVFSVTLHTNYGKALNHSMRWPTMYHFKGEEIHVTSNVVKPFEIWYNEDYESNYGEKFTRFRIDYFNGTDRAYYEHCKNQEYKMFNIHPETQRRNMEAKEICYYGYLVVNSTQPITVLLPDLDVFETFEYSGTRQLDGKQVQEWKASRILLENYEIQETLFVEEIEGGYWIPLRRIYKKFVKKYSSLITHIVFNYYDFEGDVSDESLIIDKKLHCDYHLVFDFNTCNYIEDAFHKFKKQHGRNYVDDEHDLRMDIFRQNWDFIQDHNNQGHGYELEINQFADKTTDELAYLNSVYVRDDQMEGPEPLPYSHDSKGHLPREFDLRKLGVVSPVHSQDTCGSCWAWAVTTSVEGALARANGGKLIDLSEQSLVDCAWGFNSFGCDGTRDVEEVYRYVENNGIPKVSDYGPYLAENGVCHLGNMSREYISKFKKVHVGDSDALKSAVFEHGPVLVLIHATQAMRFYKGGIYDNSDCQKYRRNHAVILVGYGFQNNTPYWLIKNSWGENWGASGYMLLSAENDNCNIMKYASYPVL